MNSVNKVLLNQNMTGIILAFLGDPRASRVSKTFRAANIQSLEEISKQIAQPIIAIQNGYVGQEVHMKLTRDIWGIFGFSTKTEFVKEIFQGLKQQLNILVPKHGILIHGDQAFRLNFYTETYPALMNDLLQEMRFINDFDKLNVGFLLNFILLCVALINFRFSFTYIRSGFKVIKIEPIDSVYKMFTGMLAFIAPFLCLDNAKTGTRSLRSILRGISQFRGFRKFRLLCSTFIPPISALPLLIMHYRFIRNESPKV